MAKEDRLKRKEIKAYKKYQEAKKSGDGDKTQKTYDKLQKRQVKSIMGNVEVDYDTVATKKGFPEIKEKNKGKFTKWVEKNMPGTDTCKAASKIMRSKTKKYSPSVVKMANYANNFGCSTKK